MKLRTKDIDISTGGPLVAILNIRDAKKLDLHPLDRILISKGKKRYTLMIDVSGNNKTVPPGRIALFKESIQKTRLAMGEVVDISLAKTPKSIEFIKKKLDGETLDKSQIDQIVEDIVYNRLSQIEMAYFVAACYTKAMTQKETILLTKSMASYGDILDLDKYPIVDKHCIGGVPGNRTTMVLVPILAAAGFYMPKTSSRSITSPAGTADTMEVIADVCFGLKQIKKIVKKTNACIVWGGALNLAPADDAIIKVERPLGLDAESQLLASIMAKKHSVSSTHILIDIPVGKSSKVKDKKEATLLKEHFEAIGKKLNKHIKVMITYGDEPIGNGIGPGLEARDILWLLKRDFRRPLDLERKCISMAAEMFKLLGIKDGKRKALEILETGEAYKKMLQIIRAQGGKEPDTDKIRLGKYRFDFVANRPGKICAISNMMMSKVARVAGAPENKGAGAYLYRHVGDRVRKNEKIFTVYSESKEKLGYAREVLNEMKGITIR